MPDTATSAELDTTDRDGSLIWEVDVFGKDHKNHDVTVDAASGKVLNQHVDHDDNDNQDDGDDDQAPGRLSEASPGARRGRARHCPAAAAPSSVPGVVPVGMRSAALLAVRTADLPRQAERQWSPERHGAVMGREDARGRAGRAAEAGAPRVARPGRPGRGRPVAKRRRPIPCCTAAQSVT
ncbi:PepSY domain-containing protein [Streptomyces sp. NBRC 110028]|uniref:PepSY domain-containing protein n=1 Tax=Streptomyces sp. NBRC 110028 TaxID=1621260 RepID=UPI000AFD5FE2|nr:PepSY domain-containing protein [Streptomyces sp. NBRC 110028]